MSFGEEDCPTAVNSRAGIHAAHDGVRSTVKLHILGAGTPQPLAERWGSAYALQAERGTLMIDCGPAATHRLLRAGLKPTDVEWLFFTHHHSDHNVDYPCLMLFRWDQSTGEPPLKVIGPPPTEEMTAKLFGPDGAFADDIRARMEDVASQRCHLQRGGTLPRAGPRYEARDVEPGAVIEGQGWTATCARGRHMQPLLWPLTWRFDFAGSSVCFTGDTAPSEEVVGMAAGVDTLVANAPQRQERLHPDLATCICGTLDAATLARDAGAGRLILVHLTSGLFSEGETAVSEMREIYDGEIVLAEELMSFDV